MIVVASLYKIDDLEVTPKAFSVEYEDISNAIETYDGEFSENLIRTRRKVVWTFESLDDSKASVIRKYMNDCINSHKNRYFNITTDSPDGVVTFKAYKGTPETWKCTAGTPKTGYARLWNIELHFIEKVGTKYNNPGALPS